MNKKMLYICKKVCYIRKKVFSTDDNNKKYYMKSEIIILGQRSLSLH